MLPTTCASPLDSLTETRAEAPPWHSTPITANMAAAAPSVRQTKRNKLKIFSPSLYGIGTALARENLAAGAVSPKDIVPAEYHDFLPPLARSSHASCPRTAHMAIRYHSGKVSPCRSARSTRSTRWNWKP